MCFQQVIGCKWQLEGSQENVSEQADPFNFLQMNIYSCQRRPQTNGWFRDQCGTHFSVDILIVQTPKSPHTLIWMYRRFRAHMHFKILLKLACGPKIRHPMQMARKQVHNWYAMDDMQVLIVDVVWTHWYG